MNVLKTLKGVMLDFKHFFWPPTSPKKALRSLLFVVAVIAGGRFLLAEPAITTEPTPAAATAVTLVTAAETASGNAANYVGTVRAVSEAQIQNEVAGRVTSVAVQPGEQVAAGTIIATLENSAQRAAVLQAEGAYESALASAAQSETGVEGAESSLTQARNSAVATVRGAANTYANIVITTVDTFFSNPDGVVPGVRIDSRYTSELNANRVALTNQLNTIQTLADTITVNDDLPAALNQVADTGSAIITLVDYLIDDVRRADRNETLGGVLVTSYSDELLAARSQLNSTKASLESGATSIAQAQTALTQARQAAVSSPETVSAADAQVKSALGSLRSAQAQLAKTILRTPIAGTVNEVGVNTGDFISAFTQIAEVANNGSLEVSFFVTDSEAANLTVGQTVQIASRATGTIVSIAPAVSQATQKTEVRAAIDATDLTNGSTVTVTPVIESESTAELPTTPRLPLTAVRFTATAGSVFVVENGVLRQQPVSLGSVRGSTIEITEGITNTDQVVADVRGLTAGQSVTITN